MKFFRSHWFFILAAVITIIGLVTGWYFFFLLVLPLGAFSFRGKDRDD